MALELIDVTAGYGRGPSVLVGAALSVRARGLVHLVGENGSGKSTVVELASGYLRARQGRVLVSGLSAHDPRARARRRVCRTRLSLYSEMTAHDHLLLAARFVGVSAAEALERFEAYGAGEWLHRSAGQLSIGNARKLWIVMTTLGSFELVVLDEPFEGLDDHGTSVLLSEVERWRCSSAVVMITHRLPTGVVVDDVVRANAPEGPGARSQASGGGKELS